MGRKKSKTDGSPDASKPKSNGEQKENGSAKTSSTQTGYLRWTLFYLVAPCCIGFLIITFLKRNGIVEDNFPLNDSFDQIFSQINETISETFLTEEAKRPGFQLSQQGAKAKYGVVIVPGFVTSGLEVWGGQPCARKHFRQRIWTAMGSATSFISDRECWSRHMSLDPFTGMDPEGIRLRAAQGFQAVDFFFANYWVFGKLIANLADVGYQPSTMTVAPFDWRLAFPLLETRDGYFTHLKSQIENLHKTKGEKVVVISHSMGALVMHYFFAWVTESERNGGGGGGKKWVDQHMHAYINLAGVHLGVPKAASALLSGEMSDTAMLGAVGSVVEQIYGRVIRRDLFTTWGSLWAMLPKGGDAIWGPGVDMCDVRSADDPLCPESKASPLITMTDEPPVVENLKDSPVPSGGSDLNTTVKELVSRQEHSTEQIIDFLLAYGGSLGPEISSGKVHSLYGKERSSSKVWHDPTRTPLPYAPNMQLFCLYGVGVETERAYYYKRNREEDNNSTDPPLIIDWTIHNDTQGVKYGGKFVDGDGSVPLVSLGYMCADAWQRRDSRLNPSNVPVYTREYSHETKFQADDPMRGGPFSADHVDLLGNVGVTEDVIRIVTGFGVDEVKTNKIVSDIEAIAEKINNNGGIPDSRQRG